MTNANASNSSKSSGRVNYPGNPDSSKVTACQDCGSSTGKPLAKFCDGCRWKHRGKKPLYPLTPERRAFIQRHYTVADKGCTLHIAATLQVPKWRVVRWAAEMGLCTPMPKSPDWRAEEIAFLEEHIGARHPNWIAKRLDRSITAVVVKSKRLSISRRECRDWLTASNVALGFGVDASTAVRWIERRWLKAERFGHDHADGRAAAWKVKPSAVRRFVREHPTAFALAKVDQVWFLDMVFGCLGERWRDEAVS
jgi:hypothetical protein